ncbi:MAG: choice-of-anchor L domain-containing protein [candidate division Zixibacteria bacterium]|nr:choice-of-anchor L domain-containing protein [candidate division Zixibacteria bacterium]
MKMLTILVAIIAVLFTTISVIGKSAPASTRIKPDNKNTLTQAERLDLVESKTSDKDYNYNPMAACVTVTPDNDPYHLIDALLIPWTGITIKSVTFTGASTAAGLYVDGPFNINDGIILATGDVTNALPPDTSTGTSTDFDLEGCPQCSDLIPGYTSYDAAIFEIVFDVNDSCQSISFDFVFGSEEYPEYVGSEYNDVFGAYLNGTQVAFDSDGNSITINGPFFSGDYVSTPPDNGFEYDGSTIKLTTIAPVTPGSADNTLVFVICDAGDHILDSGVMLADLEGDVEEDTVHTGIAPEFIQHGDLACGDTLDAEVGVPISIDIEAVDLGPNDDIVTLMVDNIPAGATMTPSLPLTDNPVTSAFGWTPTASQAGETYTVTFTAADSIDGFIENCKYTFVVETTDSCYPDLPAPELVMEPCLEYYEVGDNWVYRYSMNVLNLDVYPQELFEPRPDLPPCGGNSNASRTWIDIYESDGTRIYGFCALYNPESLNNIWFGISEGTIPPDSVYITMTDRVCDITYTSNMISTANTHTEPLVECPSEPFDIALEAPGEVCVKLPVNLADSVDAGDATWVNDTLCFYAESTGEYVFDIIASNECGADSCAVVVNVSIAIEDEHVIPTTTWINVYCDGPTYNGETLSPGDTIRAYDADSVLCGMDVVRADGTFGFMPIYHDDIYTDEVDEGAEACDLISFTINGLPVLSNPDVYWTANGDEIEVCNFYNCNTIHLHNGWNLISWNLDYTANVSEFASLMGKCNCVDVILGFDNGALTYDPSLPDYSTLKNVDYSHGYWVKMDCDVDISICGKIIPKNQCISVFEGWNLVSYWPNHVLPIDEALVSIIDDVEVVFAYDNGYSVYVPSDRMYSSMFEMSPFLGYWLKMNNDNYLAYPGWTCEGGDAVARVRAPIASNSVEPSRVWMSIYGKNLTLDGETLESGTNIEAFTSDGTLCGSGVYTDGLLKFTPIYGFDGQIKAYPREGDPIILHVDGQSVYPHLTFSNDGQRISVSRFSSEFGGTGVIPARFGLSQNYPNPFNPTTMIDFSLAEPGHVELTVFNVLGQEVTILIDDQLDSGEHQITWDGYDSNGKQVSSGIYLYRLKAGSDVSTRKMLLTK